MRRTVGGMAMRMLSAGLSNDSKIAEASAAWAHRNVNAPVLSSNVGGCGLAICPLVCRCAAMVEQLELP